MRPYNLTCFLFLFAMNFLVAQNFDITYSQSITQLGAAIEQTPDGGFVVSCKGDAAFLKLDANGQIDWTFDNYPGSEGAGVFTFDNGDIALGGSKPFNGFLTLVDANGSIQYEELFNGQVRDMAVNSNDIVHAIHKWGNSGIPVALDRRNPYTGYIGNEGDFYGVTNVQVATDGGYYLGGATSQNPFLRKYNVGNGVIDLVWEYKVQSVSYSGIWSMTEATDGSVYGVGSIYGSSDSTSYSHTAPYLVKLDANGNVLFEKILPGVGSLHSIREMANGNFVLAGNLGGAVQMEVSPQGNMIWDRRYSNTRCFSCRSIPTADGGFALLANGQNDQVRVIKTDAQGNVFNTFVEGTLLADADTNCLSSAPDSFLVNRTVTATDVNSGFIFTSTSDALGNYSIDAPAGAYKITASLVPNWQACEATTVTLANNATSVTAPDKVYKYNAIPTGVIQGQVFIDANGNCEFDAGEEVLPCIKIPWSREQDAFSGPIYYAETDENGFYSIEVPAVNHYFLNRFNNTLWSAPPSAGCFFNEGYLPAYDTLFSNFPLADDYITPTYISGHVYIDENLNCERDSLEITTDNFAVGLIPQGTSDTTCIQPLIDGYFAQILEAGIYEVIIKFDGNPNWFTCDTSLVVNASGTCMDEINLSLQPEQPCPDYTISVASGGYRLCADNSIFVNYQNIGTATDDAEIQVILDTLMTYQNSSITPSAINGDTLLFTIDSLEALETGNFFITVFLSCDAVLGETHCVSATMDSPLSCTLINADWDGSSVQITGICEGDQLKVRIENIGDAPMSEELNYSVIEDNILLYQNPFQLGIGGFVEFDLTPNGAFIFVEAEQSANHPARSMPAGSFEGCGGENVQGGFSMGYVTQYREDDASNNVSIFCIENTGPFDPNDKQGFPRGISAGNFIEADTPIEYLIRFQNVGTASAINVYITDVLSSFLDPATFRAGASSHDYEVEFFTNDVVIFTFENINLPDSTSDLAGSQGFISFTIDQKSGNLPGTSIENLASIVFDSNDAILTNTTVHRIPNPTEAINTSVELCAGDFWNGQMILNDTSFTVTNPYLFYEQVENLDFTAFPVDVTTIDTLLALGQVFQGINYFEPTNLVDTLENEFGCDSIVYINIDIFVGTDNLLQNEIKVSPNPTTEKVWVTLSEITDSAPIEVSLFNQTGQKILEQNSALNAQGFQEIDLSEFPSGIYFLKVKMNDHHKVVKLIKI